MPVNNFYLIFVFLFILNFSGMQILGQDRALGVIGKDKEENTSKKVALVIGNKDYDFSKDLKNPVNDAELISKKLKKLGFEIIEDAINLDRKEFILKLREFRNMAKDSEVAVFYYAGHGIENNGINYMIPTDANLEEPEDLKPYAIDMSEVFNSNKRSKTKYLLFMDACRDNPFSEKSYRFRSDSAATSSFKNIEFFPGTQTFISYASSPGQKASDGYGENSPYAISLGNLIDIKGLSLDELQRRLVTDVKSKTGNKQIPKRNDNLEVKFFFNPPSDIENEDVYWNRIKNSDNSRDFILYLDNYPQGKYRKQAEKKLEKINDKDTTVSLNAGKFSLGLENYRVTLGDENEYSALNSSLFGLELSYNFNKSFIDLLDKQEYSSIRLAYLFSDNNSSNNINFYYIDDTRYEYDNAKIDLIRLYFDYTVEINSILFAGFGLGLQRIKIALNDSLNTVIASTHTTLGMGLQTAAFARFSFFGNLFWTPSEPPLGHDLPPQTSFSYSFNLGVRYGL